MFTFNNKGQAATTVLAIVGVIILGALIWWAFANTGGDTTDNEERNGAVQDGEPLQVPNDWQTYNNEQLNFSIKYPPQVTVEESTEGRVQFQLVGPDSQAGSEITDGFTLTIANENTSGYSTLEAYVDARYQEMGRGVQPPQATTFNDRAAYAFVVSSQLGTTVEHLYVAHNVGTTLHLSWSVQDVNEQGYAGITDLMLRTLEMQANGSGVALFTRVNVALLDTNPDGEPQRGCDNVVFVQQETVTPTTQPLNAALTRLFLMNEEQVDGNFNFIARTNETLSFQRATVESGTANIYLTGQLSGLAGVCDNPRAKIQIEETALQFSTVNDVRIFLNGEETELQPSGQ